MRCTGVVLVESEELNDSQSEEPAPQQGTLRAEVVRQRAARRVALAYCGRGVFPQRPAAVR